MDLRQLSHNITGYWKQMCVINHHLLLSYRAHRNDMENIYPFLFLGAVYALTGPSLAVARFHFLVFFLARLLHSVAYLFALRAPTRSLAYIIAQIPCVSMAVQILIAVAVYAWKSRNEELNPRWCSGSERWWLWFVPCVRESRQITPRGLPGGSTLKRRVSVTVQCKVCDYASAGFCEMLSVFFIVLFTFF